MIAQFPWPFRNSTTCRINHYFAKLPVAARFTVCGTITILMVDIFHFDAYSKAKHMPIGLIFINI